MPIKFPLQVEKAVWPLDSICGVCSRPISNASIYLNAGAGYDSLQSPAVELEAFWDFHIHAVGVDQCAHVEVVRLPGRDQFDLCFCSTNCMRLFLNEIVDQLESQVKK